MTTALVVLAAGKGTRMNSDLPKVLHRIGGAPLFWHAVTSGAALEPERVVLVVGHGAEAVHSAAGKFGLEVTVALQAEQNGTGHAVAQALPHLDGFAGDVMVLFGDTPFLRGDTMLAMKAARDHHDVVVLGFEAADPTGYGRLVMDGAQLQRIVEHKDASEAERALTFCNGGLVMADAETLRTLVAGLGNDNAAGEYYLTDIVALADARGLTCTAVACDEAETMGVNTRAQLAEAEAIFQRAKRAEALETGVSLEAPDTVFFSYDTHLGRDVYVEPNVVFAPGVTAETGAQIRAFSHLEGAHVGAGAVVGPYARLRPGAELDANVRIGNFVEVKNASLGEGAKVSHLSYVGDASVGRGSNLGAGTVTCNYNGVEKFHTEIGERVFVGSNTMLVAPVALGDEAMTASGSVITRDVPDGALALGRAEQVTKPGAGKRLMEINKMAKEKRQRGK